MAKRTKTIAQVENQMYKLADRLNAEYVQGNQNDAQRNRVFGNRLDRVFAAGSRMQEKMDRLAYETMYGTRPAGRLSYDEVQRFVKYRNKRKFTLSERLTGVRSAMGSGR
jgi:hypothetical protein